MATNYESLEWTTSGDGTFDDATLINPVYTPGDQDIENGEAELTFTAHGESEDKSDNMMILISTPAAIALGDDASSCGSSDITPEVITAENFAALMWSTDGDGTFNDTGISNPVYTPGEQDIANGSVNLTLTAEAMGGCEDVSDDIAYTIHALPTATIEGAYAICQGSSTDLEIHLTGTGPWSFAFGEEQQVYEAQETPFIISVMPVGPWSYNIHWITDANGCTNDDPQASHNVEPMPNPEFSLINDTTICHNHIITLDPAIDNVTYEWSTGETTNTIDVDITGVEIGDTKSIGLTVSNEFGCTADDEVNVTFKDCTGIGELAKDVMMSVYPNPNNGQFTLSLQSDETQTVNIVMVNILGEVMEESGEITFNDTYSRTFDLENMSAGVYFIRVNSDNGVLIQRLVIE